MPAKPTVSVILGAGFSHAAGLPLARDLLDSRVFLSSRTMSTRFSEVWNAWDEFRLSRPDSTAELFLQSLYEATEEPLIRSLWPDAVRLVGAALATPRGDDFPIVRNPRYAGRITTEVRSGAHRAFWDTVLSVGTLEAVITLNYDILSERGLRHRPIRRTNRPGFFYGGMAKPQILNGLALPWATHDRERLVELNGGVPVFKLHGSLNWAEELGELVMYQDQRSAFRNQGPPLIVPPILEKERPLWLAPVWDGAMESLSRSDVWIVCGYSLPPYDLEVASFLRSASGAATRVLLLDPSAAAIRSRWESVAPRAMVSALPGLPEGAAELLNSAT